MDNIHLLPNNMAWVISQLILANTAGLVLGLIIELL